MRTAIYFFALLLSLPNLLAGLALAVLQHSFSTRNPLLIMLNFFEASYWGIAITLALLVLLATAGCFRETRAYAAALAIVLNVAALVLVFIRIGPPPELGQWFVFVPVALALLAFGWISWCEFRRRSARAQISV